MELISAGLRVQLVSLIIEIHPWFVWVQREIVAAGWGHTSWVYLIIFKDGGVSCLVAFQPGSNWCNKSSILPLLNIHQYRRFSKRLLKLLLRFLWGHVHIDFMLVKRLMLSFNGPHVTRIYLNVLALGRAVFVCLTGGEKLLGERVFHMRWWKSIFECTILNFL